MRVVAPCQNCTDRYVGCHSQCSRFLEYQELHKEDKKLRYEAHKVEDEIRNAASAGIQRMKSRRASNRFH